MAVETIWSQALSLFIANISDNIFNANKVVTYNEDTFWVRVKNKRLCFCSNSYLNFESCACIRMLGKKPTESKQREILHVFISKIIHHRVEKNVNCENINFYMYEVPILFSMKSNVTFSLWEKFSQKAPYTLPWSCEQYKSQKPDLGR